MQSIMLAEKNLEGCGRVLVRYSGTQPMCRVMVEGPDKHVVGKLVNLIAKSVKDNIGR
jgi:phosphoglucosamine mutase